MRPVVFLFILVLFSSFAHAQVDYEPSISPIPLITGIPVGRIVGDSPNDLINALKINEQPLQHATYYSNRSPYSSTSVLNKAFNQNTNIKQADTQENVYWDWSDLSSDIDNWDSSELLIVEGYGTVEGSKVVTRSEWNDSSTSLKPSDTESWIDDFEAHEPLVVLSSSYAGTYLPNNKEGNNSFLSNLTKNATVIAANGVANNGFLHSLLCSLERMSKKYPVSSESIANVGSALQLARRRFYSRGSIFEPSKTIASYNLYGLPYAGLYTPGELTGSLSCWPYFESSDYKIERGEVLLLADDSSILLPTETAGVYEREITLTINDYEEQFVDEAHETVVIDGTLPILSEGSLVLPLITHEEIFPKGTIITSVTIEELSNPEVFNLNLGAWNGSGFDDASCEKNTQSVQVIESRLLGDNQKLQLGIVPVQVDDCGAGDVTLFKKVRLRLGYRPELPVVMTVVETTPEVDWWTDANVVVGLENISFDTQSVTLELFAEGQSIDSRIVSLNNAEYKEESFVFNPPSNGVNEVEVSITDGSSSASHFVYVTKDIYDYTTLIAGDVNVSDPLSVSFDALSLDKGPYDVNVVSRLVSNSGEVVGVTDHGMLNVYKAPPPPGSVGCMSMDCQYPSITASASFETTGLVAGDYVVEVLLSLPWGEESFTTAVELISTSSTITLDSISDFTVKRGDIVVIEPPVKAPNGTYSLVNHSGLAVVDSGVLVVDTTALNGSHVGSFHLVGDSDVHFNLSASGFDVSSYPVKEEFTLNVTSNSAPTITASDVVGSEGNLLTVTASASDLEGDGIYLSLSSELPFEKVSAGEWAWLPSFDDAGSYSVTLLSTDGLLHSSETVNITVTNTNRAPVLLPSEGLFGFENSSIAIVPFGFDPDGDALTYSVALSDGTYLTVETGSNEYYWTPSFDDAGDQSFVISVSDGEFTVSETINAAVFNVNQDPTLELEDVTVLEGDVAMLEPVVLDLDGDVLTFNLYEESTDFNTDNTSSFTWETGFDDAGEHSVWLSVTDGTSIVSEEVTITVLNSNRPPVSLSDFDDVMVSETDKVTLFKPEVSDLDNDLVTVSLESEIDFVDAGDSWVWLTSYDDEGEYSVSVVLDDNTDSSYYDLTVTVLNVNRDSDVLIEDVVVFETETVIVDPLVADPDGGTIVTSIEGPISKYLTKTGSVWSWDTSYDDAGAYSGTVVVDDGESVVEEQFNVVVLNLNRLPVLGSLSNRLVYSSSVVRVKPFAVDPDGDELSFDIGSSTATFEEFGWGIWSWTPLSKDVGTHEVFVLVSDGFGETRGNFNVDVKTSSQNTAITTLKSARKPVGDVPEGDVIEETPEQKEDTARERRTLEVVESRRAAKRAGSGEADSSVSSPVKRIETIVVEPVEEVRTEQLFNINSGTVQSALVRVTQRLERGSRVIEYVEVSFDNGESWFSSISVDGETRVPR
ncbi:MAG: hypothetical protein GOV15_04670 [Candidatus Diapherotrites archaeon]|nr:hypothetical protein [Candidatus Diapherotrites archaeon]